MQAKSKTNCNAMKNAVEVNEKIMKNELRKKHDKKSV